MRTRSRHCPTLEHEYIAMREDLSHDPPLLFLYCQRCADYRFSELEPRAAIPQAILRSFEEAE